MIQKHTHKLRKIKYKSGNSTFFCVLDCSFKISPALALGKKTICNRCGEEFILNEYSIRLTKPHCVRCHKSKDKIDSGMTEIVITPAPILSLSERLQQTTSKQDEEI